MTRASIGAVQGSRREANAVLAPRLEGGEANVSPAAGSPAARRGGASPALPVDRGEGEGHTTRDDHTSPARPDPAVDAFVAVYAALVDDAERARIALAHRLDRLTRTDEWGRGIPAEHPEMQILAAQLEANAEHEAGLIAQLQRAVERHPLGAWQRSVVGVGAKQLGRLLGCIGNPYWHGPEDRPRTVDQLRAYCGYSVVGGEAQRLRAGVQANWNSGARKRAFLIAESCIKQARSPYRPVYDDARARYAGAVVRGEPITDGHAHMRALRAVAKELLLDLWREARARTLAGDYVLRQRVRRGEQPMTHPSDRLGASEAKQHEAA